MSKPYTDADLSAQLVVDRTWRVRELTDLRAAIERSDAVGERVLLRALVAVCYAHWEGYIRFAARKYLEHISLRRLTFSELNRQFLRNLFLPRLAALSITKTSVQERCDLVDQILDSGGKRFSQVNDDLVNTQSNLSFQVFTDVCLVCEVPIVDFVEHRAFIDVLLLKRRNAIAHGEETFVYRFDMPVLIDTSIELMRRFGDALDNQATLRSYRLA